MADPTSPTPRIDPVVEYYKQFVNRRQLRENLTMSPDERWRRLQSAAEARKTQRAQPPGPNSPWQAISDCGPNRSSDPILELYKRDIDRTLLRENLKRSTRERCEALTSMARLVVEFHYGNSKSRQTS